MTSFKDSSTRLGMTGDGTPGLQRKILRFALDDRLEHSSQARNEKERSFASLWMTRNSEILNKKHKPFT